MSLILEEFEKENIEEALVKLKEKIFDYDVISRHKKIVAEYKTPSNYVAQETRSLSYSKVKETTLDFIVCKCRRCPLEIRISATRALLSKYYDKIKDRYDEDTIKDKISNMKKKIIEQIEQTADDLSLGEDFDFGTLPTATYSEILYFIQIKIGSNYLKKIGITSRETMKPRIAEIKSSYRANAKQKFSISIKPIYIYSMNNASEIEKEFIIKVNSKGGKFDTKYVFDGSNECVTGKYSKLADNLFLELINGFSKGKYQVIFG